MCRCVGVGTSRRESLFNKIGRFLEMSTDVGDRQICQLQAHVLDRSSNGVVILIGIHTPKSITLRCVKYMGDSELSERCPVSSCTTEKTKKNKKKSNFILLEILII